MELLSLSVHTAPFSVKNRYLSFSVHTYSQNPSDYLFLIAVSVFKFLRFLVFWCSHYKNAFLAPVLRWCNVNAKLKTKLSISFFLHKNALV